MKFLLILLIFIVIYSIIRNTTIFVSRVGRSRGEFHEDPPPPQPAKPKMIDKDEGEYVDYEEIRK